MNIEMTIKEIISKVLGVGMEIIQDDLAIGDIAEWDSLHHLQIISTIEKEYGFKFTPDVMMDLEDVEDIIHATKERVNV